MAATHQDYRSRRETAWPHILMACGAATAILAPLILFIELFEWATSSEWPGLTLADGLGLFGVEHALPETDEQRLLDLLLALPLSVALFLCGVSAFLLGTSAGDWSDERRLVRALDRAPPIEWIALVLDRDVRLPALIRLLLLDALLRGIAVVGSVALAVELVLILRGGATGWLAAGGVLLLALAGLTRRAERRKLPGLHAQ